MEKERIACVVTRRNAEILNLQEELEQMGYDCRICYLDSYAQTHSYWKKKFVELAGKNRWEWKHYLNRLQEEIVERILAYHPQKVLFINLGLTEERLHRIAAQAKIVFWHVDPVKNLPEEKLACAGGYPIFVYDMESQRYLEERGIVATYCPVGYNRAYHRPEQLVTQDIDISFVGSPYKKRLEILEPLARAAEEHGWTFRVFGPFFETRYFWKRQAFRFRYPYLFRHLTNGTMASEEIADIYHRSKICLNLHGNGSDGVNPRTFEVLASGAMELIDERFDYDILQPGRDVAVFSDVENLIDQVEWYLRHEEERRAMAGHGWQKIHGVRSMESCLQMLLGDEHGSQRKTDPGDDGRRTRGYDLLYAGLAADERALSRRADHLHDEARES